MQTQKQLINRLHWMWKEYPFEAEEVMGQRAALNTIPSLWDLLGGLLAGIPTVVVPDAVIQDSEKLINCLYEKKISFITLTPSILRLISLNEGENSDKTRYLRVVLTLGEKFTQKIYEDVRKTLKKTIIVNDYGSTETHTNLYGKYDENVKDITKEGLKQITNVNAFILDSNDKIADYEVIGELCVAGPNIAKGYLNSPKLNSEKFINWQQDKNKESIKLFKTGDLAYRKRGGKIFLIGRRDHVLKVNGKRVDIDGLENVLLSFPKINEGVIIGQKLSTGKIMLKAFVTLKEDFDKKVACEEIEKHCKRYLPEFMIPKQFIILDSMPQTPSGKVNYKVLEKLPEPKKAEETFHVEGNIEKNIASILSKILETKIEESDYSKEFALMGIDSVIVMELSIQLKKQFNIKISPTDIFDYPNIKKLGKYINSIKSDKLSTQDYIHKNNDDNDDIVVIGMSGQFPGAETIDKLWTNLKNEVCSISEIPKDRWDIDRFYDSDPSKEEYSYSKWGGFLSNIDKFDAKFFDFSSKEAKYMDPQQRLCLMESYKAVENAGYNPLNPKLSDVGVFIGASVFDYEKLVNMQKTPCVETVLGNEISIIASRISYFNNFTGPSMVIDTACSSSLTAFHLACQSIKMGDCKMALAGGVSVVNNPDFYVGTSKLNVFSKSGLCKTFDNSADGFVNGEGVAFVVLKSLKDAIKDKDNILAVVKGSVINQDGRSNGITAPNGQSQGELERKLYEKYNIPPESIGYIEAHGTGTRLGDLIEVESLTKVYSKYSKKINYCAIGSIKTNIGHLTSAAGITGVIKAILCLYNKALVPSINFNEPNKLIEWENSPFYVNTEFKKWKQNDENIPRRAAVNSFGIGGTNVHCVLEEYRDEDLKTHIKDTNNKFLIPISAASKYSLKAKLENLRKWIDKNKENYRICDLSYVAVTGRYLFENGYVIIADSFEDLDKKIVYILNHKENDEIISIKKTAKGEETLANVDNITSLGKALAAGIELDHNVLFKGIDVKRISVPVYPFDLCSYYVDKNTIVKKEEEKSRVSIEENNDKRNTLISLIADALGEDKEVIDINKPLEEMGFDSLKAISLKNKINSVLNSNISISKLLNGNSVSSIMNEVIGKAIEKAPISEEITKTLDLKEPFDLTEMQQSYYVGRNKFNIDSIGCHTYIEFEIDEIKEELLEKSWNILLKHHPMLRAKILKNGKQKIEEYKYYKFTTYEVEDEEKDQLLSDIRNKLSHKIYQPDESPLYTIVLTKFKEKNAIVHFSIDSWIIDGRSADILFSQWKNLYYNLDYPLKELKVNFWDYVEAVKKEKKSEGYKKQLDYWINKLSGFKLKPQLPLNEENEMKPGSFYNRKNYEYTLEDRELWNKVKKYLSGKKLSATSVLLTIFADTLKEYNARDEFALIVTIMNRYMSEEDIQEVVGPFTSSTIFTVRSKEDKTLKDRIDDTQDQLYHDMDNSMVSGITVMRELKNISASEKSIPIVFTSMINNKKYDLSFNHDITYSISQTPQVYIECKENEKKGKLNITWTVAEGSYKREFIEEAFTSYCTSIEEYFKSLFIENGSSIKLSQLQSSYLYSRVIEKDSKSGLIYKDFTLENIDINKLTEAVNEIINNHKSLKYSINVKQQCLKLEGCKEFKVKINDLSSLKENEKIQAFENYKEEFKKKFIKGISAPRFDLAVTKIEHNNYYLMVCLDMVVFDAPSSYMLIDELFKLYKGGAIQRNREYRYSDYVTLKESRIEDSSNYWLSKFEKLEDGPKWRYDDFEKNNEFLTYHAEFNIYEKLLRKAEELRVKPISILITAYEKVLSKWALNKELSVLAIDYKDRQLNKDFEYSIGDYTSFSWIENNQCLNMSFEDSVKLVDRIIDEDLKHNTSDALNELILFNKNNAEPKSYNAVITNCLDSNIEFLDKYEINDSYSNTPGVVIDNVVCRTSYGITFEWQVLKDAINEEMALSMFKDYRYLIKELALNERLWKEMYSSNSLFNDIKKINYHKYNNNKLSREEYENVVYKWNDTDCAYNESILLQELIEEKARTNGDAPAVITDDKVLTYRELNEEANKLAEYIINHEEKSNAPIGIFIERTERMIINILAVLKAGQAYLPFNIDDPIERIESIIEEAKTTLIITSEKSVKKLEQANVKLLVTENLDLDKYHKSTNNIRNKDAKSTDLAYVIFTSGSTGKPKGVAVNHKSVVNLIEWAKKAFNFNSNDKVLFVNPINFDLSVFDIFGILATGGSIRLVFDNNRYNPFYLIDVINKENITFWNSAPAYLKMLMQTFKIRKIENPSLRLFFLSGDWIPVTMPEEIKKIFKDAKFVSLGGATEATVWSNYYIVKEKDKEYPSIPYGKPIQNSKYYILDENHQPCGVGEPGELYISGECLSQGYYNNEKLTRERYIPNPFVDEDILMYKTGDQAKFHSDGNIEFVGRIDNQVKIRGYRVELGEVEAALRKCGLQDAVVVTRGVSMEEKRLVSFVKGDKVYGKIEDESIWSEINNKVSKYMIPSDIYALPNIPITSSGKVDRKKLMNSSIDELLEVSKDEGAKEIKTIVDDELFVKYIDEKVKLSIADILSIDISQIENDSNLGDLNFNSLQYTVLGINIAKELNFEVNPALFFKYNVVSEIIDFLSKDCKEDIINSMNEEDLKKLSKEVVEYIDVKKEIGESNNIDIEKRPNLKIEENSTDGDDDSIAIIGINGIMPQAPDLDAFWNNLENSINSVEVIPKDRWDWKKVYGNPKDKENVSDVKYGYFIEDIRKFDPLFFGISPREAELMDPRQRLLMESIWHLLEGAGYNPKALRGSDTAIFIGATGDEYLTISSKTDKPIDEFTLMGTSRTVLPNRISYYFDWHGASEVIDTACSSSLVAIHRAVHTIRTGESSMAIAAGINLIMEPRPHISLDKVGMLSKDGKCKTFDESADGYGRGEGVGTILLKSLRKAKEDHDNIIAVIKGTAINHGGKASALTAPNPKAQTALLKKAIENAKINVAEIGYIETHGTGTALGDPIEIEGIKDAMTYLYKKDNLNYTKKRIALGSVKSNIGHLESAAGIAGALKLILSLKNKRIPPTINVNKVNDKIKINNTPLYIALGGKEWAIPYDDEGNELLRAGGVSAFGFGGVNAHIVIEEFNRKGDFSIEDKENYIILLSAKNRDSLRNIVEGMLIFLRKNKEEVSLADVAYTLQIGRQSFDERAVIITNSLDDLIEKLESLLKNSKDYNIFTGSVREDVHKIKNLYKDKTYDEKEIFERFTINEIATLWSWGAFDRWEEFWKDKEEKPYRIELPGYVFNNKDYWIESNNKKTVSKESKVVQKEIKTAKFKLTGKEKLLTDHVINGGKILPGAMYFEYINAVTKKKFPICIKDVIWINTLTEKQLPAEITVLTKKEEEYETVSFRYNDNIETCNAMVKANNKNIEEAENFNVDVIKKRFKEKVYKPEIYKVFRENNISYGTYFKSINELWLGDKEALAYVKVENANKNVTFHPGVIDAAFQTAVFDNIRNANEKAMFFPFSLEEACAYEKLPNRCYIYVKKDSKNKLKTINKYNIYIINMEGKVVMKIKSYTGRVIKSKGDEKNVKLSKNIALYKEQYEYLTTINEDTVRDDNSFRVLINFNKKYLVDFKNTIIVEASEENYKRISENFFRFDLKDEKNWQRFYEEIRGLGVNEFIYYVDNKSYKNASKEYELMHSLSKILIKNAVTEKSTITIVTERSKDFSKPLISFGKTIEQENPKVKFRYIKLLTKNKDRLSLSKLLMVTDNIIERKEGHEFVLNLDNNKCYVKRIAPYKQEDGYKELNIIKGKPYLITGGSGKIGITIAKEVSRRGGIVLLEGRSDLSEEKSREIDSINNAFYYKADVSRYEELREFINKVEEEFGDIKGVFHCAGIVDDKMLIRKSKEEALEVLKPKINGTMNLDKILNKDKLDFFVLFSSLTSVSGNVGQCDYAYANGFLDDFANISKKAVISFNWPLFKDGGLKINDTEFEYIRENVGMNAITNEDFIDILFKFTPANAKNILVLSGKEQKLCNYINSRI